MPLRVYLSGSIPKGRDDRRAPEHFWSEKEKEKLESFVGSKNLVLINPAHAKIKRQDSLANYGCDLHLVASSDVLLVDARTAKGIGIGAEMMFAVMRQIPVITWAPLGSHYHRNAVTDVFGEDLVNWTHPFIRGLSSYVVEELEEAGLLLAKALKGDALVNASLPEEAIKYFLSQTDASAVEQQ